MLSFCYNYDPQGRRYVFDILRVSGFSIAGFVGLFIVYLVVSGRRQRKKKD
jgi:protein SCO1/2